MVKRLHSTPRGLLRGMLVLWVLSLWLLPIGAQADSFPGTCNDGSLGNGSGDSEKCEDYNASDTDDCRSDCHINECGDGILHATHSDTDSSNGIPDIAYVTPPDPNPLPLEECDDGNIADSDGCAADCTIEGAGTPVCGNGVPETGESCEDGTQCDDGTPCTVDADCTGIDPAFTCETRDGDGCSATCTIEAGSCGDGNLDAGEECDDGNQNSQDQCKNGCTLNQEAINAGAVCGNGTLQAPESCDDGNNIDDDGCSNSCVDEDGSSTCGNGIVEVGETCDDGDTLATGTCDSTCGGTGTGSAGDGDGDGDGDSLSGDSGGCTLQTGLFSAAPFAWLALLMAGLWLRKRLF